MHFLLGLLNVYSSKLEQSAVVWHNSLTRKNISDLERVQKSALKLILKERYVNYKNALNVIGIDSLEQRREKLCLKFAKACVRYEKLSDMFPRNKQEHLMNKRGKELFFVKRAKTERFKKSSIISMQKLLNNEASKKKEIMTNIINYMPVNYDCMQSLSLRK